MGVVFSPEEVKFKQVPSKEDFLRAVEILKSGLRADPAILSALLLGSIVRGDSNIRSDVDCMVIYDAKHEAAAITKLQDLVQMCKRVRVPINVIPCDSETAKSGMHFFGPSFLRHLDNSMTNGGQIHGNVLAHLGKPRSKEDEATSYIRSKLYNLTETYSQYSSLSPEKRITFLKKILEAPLHVARKVVGRKEILRDDSKKKVISLYTAAMPTALGEALKELVVLDDWYTTQLEAQLKNYNESLYKACLETIENAIPKVIAFVRANALHSK